MNRAPCEVFAKPIGSEHLKVLISVNLLVVRGCDDPSY